MVDKVWLMHTFFELAAEGYFCDPSFQPLVLPIDVRSVIAQYEQSELWVLADQLIAE